MPRRELFRPGPEDHSALLRVSSGEGCRSNGAAFGLLCVTRLGERHVEAHFPDGHGKVRGPRERARRRVGREKGGQERSVLSARSRLRERCGFGTSHRRLQSGTGLWLCALQVGSAAAAGRRRGPGGGGTRRVGRAGRLPSPIPCDGLTFCRVPRGSDAALEVEAGRCLAPLVHSFLDRFLPPPCTGCCQGADTEALGLSKSLSQGGCWSSF